jgi:hypothetical protein
MSLNYLRYSVSYGRDIYIMNELGDRFEIGNDYASIGHLMA